MRLPTAIFGAALSIALSPACGGGNNDGEPTCLAAPVSTSCSALYEPTFDNVWKYTLSTTCAAAGCHSGSMPTGNMALDNEDQAYTNLISVKSANGEARVNPNDVQCGKVIVRLNSKNESYSMPPGMSLDAGTLCSIDQWIANGAKR